MKGNVAELMESLEVLLPDRDLITPTGHTATIAATNDADAIKTFMVECASRSEHTARRYTREIKRFMVWMYQVQGLTKLSELKVEDLHYYRHFLRAVPQEWHEIKVIDGVKQRPMFSPTATDKAIDGVIDVIGSLLSYLNQHGYLAGNPAARMRKLGVNTTQVEKKPFQGIYLRPVVIHCRATPQNAAKNDA